ncbi:helix-turn-helix domain-containing protein [Ochrovirga pacifica]|uniref:helix-turn-helix domain-containing protein n=1 Tax=Ochrovirga pacifica TaxID=1042376 RepID=UPI000494DC15|nr:helix-turn-helix domain-containing protein [Ochrovirga pacifica]
MNDWDTLKLLVIFSLLAAVNLLVLSLILLFKKNNSPSNKVLGLLVFIPSLVLVMNPLLYLQYFSKYLVFIFLGLSSTFLFGPLLLLYVYLVQGNTYWFKKKELLHFLPVFLVTFYGVYLNFQSREAILENYLQIVSGEDVVTNFIYLAQLIHFAIYITWSIRKVNGMRTKNYLSVAEKNNYKWLRFFVFRLLYLNVLMLLVYIVQISFFPSYMMYSDLLATPLASSCFYPIMVYKSFSANATSSEDVFDSKENKFKWPLSPKSAQVKKEDCKENAEDLHALSVQIQQHIKESKAYLTPNYAISDLAKQLHQSQRMVSDSINQVFGKNFSDLIHDYRIETSKKLLLEKSSNLTIDAIAELSGFKSRATFYRVFKDKTNLTPAQYVKKYKSVS